MRDFKRSLTRATVTLALVVGAVGTAASTSAVAQTVDPNAWYVCKHANVATNQPDQCLKGTAAPWRVEHAQYSGDFNDSISSIKTNGYVLETWNDPWFQGTYGRFGAWGTWNLLAYPYQDSISSFSSPGQ
ncbi:hypothetical protein ACFCYI_06250 [Streptomyces sp. NPDC056257]|uniref:hypothetical protein n=1 Tax=Streptomyces sp. NPDC056257 TaxID=3345765 RepID=UPI0035DFFB94